ncbi:hypothetical protein ACFW6E_25405 [Streptomyces olivaceoviridis]|uniref:hypothetical protein n=1 Tax=Streptomyces olivaceoviridis TaxID=1921 RepID=UPI0036C26001
MKRSSMSAGRCWQGTTGWLLCERRVEVLDAGVITRELLGAGPTSLAEAKTIVLTSSGRGRELRAHERFMDDLERKGAFNQ